MRQCFGVISCHFRPLWRKETAVDSFFLTSRGNEPIWLENGSPPQSVISFTRSVESDTLAASIGAYGGILASHIYQVQSAKPPPSVWTSFPITSTELYELTGAGMEGQQTEFVHSLSDLSDKFARRQSLRSSSLSTQRKSTVGSIHYSTREELSSRFQSLCSISLQLELGQSSSSSSLAPELTR